MTQIEINREPVKHGCIWTNEEEAELRRLHAEGCSKEWIAQCLGRKPSAIAHRLKELWIDGQPRSYEMRHGPISEAARVASEYFNISIHAMQQPERYSAQTWARQVAMWLAIRLGRGYANAGRFFKRDHTTAMHAERKIETLRLSNPAVLELTDALLANLLGGGLQTAPEPPPAPVPEPEPPPPPKIETPVSDDPVTFYEAAGGNQTRNTRAYLIKQNERFAAAMRAALDMEAQS